MNSLGELLEDRPKKFLRGKSPVKQSMRRGVSLALERLQRPGRLAFIASSLRQAREQAATRRAAYVKRNQEVAGGGCP